MWSGNDERGRSGRSASRQNYGNSPYSDGNDELNESERQYPDRGGNRERQWNRDDQGRGRTMDAQEYGGGMYGRGNREESYWGNQNRPYNEREAGNRGYDQGQQRGGYQGSGNQGGQYGSSRGSQGMQSQSHAGKGPKNWQRTDERMQDDVNEALARHPEIDASDIEVEVKGGELTLSGSVGDKHSKRMAEDVAESVFGVSSVENRIKVKKDNDRSNGDSWSDRSQSSSGRRAEKDVTRSADKDRAQSSSAQSSGQTTSQADGSDKSKKSSGAGNSATSSQSNIGG